MAMRTDSSNQTNRLLCRLFCLALLVLTGPGCAQMRSVATRVNPKGTDAQRDTKLDFAKAHEKEGNLPKAEETLRNVLKGRPNDVDAQHRLGVILVRRGETEEGLELLQKAVDGAPKSVAARNDLGYAYLTLGKPDLAEEQFRAALNISPKNPQALNNLALAYGYQGRTDESYTLFRQTMTEAEALANIGFIHAQLGDVDMAIQRYSQALSYDPSLRSAAEGMIQVSSVRQKVIAARQQSSPKRTSPDRQEIQLSNFSE